MHIGTSSITPPDLKKKKEVSEAGGRSVLYNVGQGCTCVTYPSVIHEARNFKCLISVHTCKGLYLEVRSLGIPLPLD